MKYLIFIFGFLNLHCNSQENMEAKNYNNLNAEEINVIINKGTEKPFIGKFTDYKEDGIYTCKQCNAQLYKSNDKFDSHCGWPSFDDEIEGAVKRVPDKDGRRVEIVCATCGGHLGHVFEGENFTPKNMRHCVNSISLNFVSADSLKLEKAIFAGGCFWGIEYHFQNLKGVIKTDVGYTGGKKEKPSYQDVCHTNTGHAEAIEITFNPSIISYEELAKLFFEIHDPTQINRQGPDIGEQYRSEIFYTNESQKQTAEKLINNLKAKGYDVVTKLTPAQIFWTAEEYHQEYYTKKGDEPYCHIYKKRF